MNSPMRIDPAFLFDVDGTLVDSVYQHVLAWKKALDVEHIDLSVWRIHRKVGMSGGLFVDQLLRETGMEIDAERVRQLSAAHAAAYLEIADGVRPLPGARELLAWLTDAGVPPGRSRRPVAWRRRASISPRSASIPPARRSSPADQVAHAKRDPDLFLVAAERLNAPTTTAFVVGDSIWDMLAATRCRALGVGLLSGGYGSDEIGGGK